VALEAQFRPEVLEVLVVQFHLEVLSYFSAAKEIKGVRRLVYGCVLTDL